MSDLSKFPTTWSARGFSATAELLVATNWFAAVSSVVSRLEAIDK